MPVAESKLRIALGTGETKNTPTVAMPPQTVTVALADVFPLLAEAANTHRAWLNDFADDQITITRDLYEVIVAYQHIRRPQKPRVA
jgi:hypothetical protein